jgi:hypothetical protein
MNNISENLIINRETNKYDPDELIKSIGERFYSDKKECELTEQLMDDLREITKNIDMYGDTHEKAVRNYFNYKQDLVLVYYGRKIKKMEQEAI